MSFPPASQVIRLTSEYLASTRPYRRSPPLNSGRFVQSLKVQKMVTISIWPCLWSLKAFKDRSYVRVGLGVIFTLTWLLLWEYSNIKVCGRDFLPAQRTLFFSSKRVAATEIFLCPSLWSSIRNCRRSWLCLRPLPSEAGTYWSHVLACCSESIQVLNYKCAISLYETESVTTRQFSQPKSSAQHDMSCCLLGLLSHVACNFMHRSNCLLFTRSRATFWQLWHTNVCFSPFFSRAKSWKSSRLKLMYSSCPCQNQGYYLW